MVTDAFERNSLRSTGVKESSSLLTRVTLSIFTKRWT
jgi:hypothetical protein